MGKITRIEELECWKAARALNKEFLFQVKMVRFQKIGILETNFKGQHFLQ